MKIKNKKEILMISAILLLSLLLVIVLFNNNKLKDELIIGSAIGGNSEPVCLWTMGDKYNLVAMASFCNRLFSRYASEGACSGTPGVVEWTDQRGNSYKFAYDGYCVSEQAGKQVGIYSGVLV